MDFKEKPHCWLPEIAQETMAGRVDRRDFIRYATFMGVSLAAASTMVALPGLSHVMAAPKGQKALLDEESPFEIKNLLIQKAKEAHAKAMKAGKILPYINAGRGNPNFLNTTARQAFAQLMLFAASVAGTGVSTPNLGFRAGKKGMAKKLADYMEKHGIGPGADFLKQAMRFAEDKLAMDADEVAFELVDAVQGDFYPDPPRILPVTEKIVNQYLGKVLYNAKPPKGSFKLFATEGATAAMIYVFKSLKINKVLKAGDTIAIFTPIFSPYLEIPELNTFNLKEVKLQGDENHGWHLQDSEIAKLMDPKIKAIFLVNPTNPTSVSLKKETVHAVADIVRKKNPNLIVLNDTVYATFVDEFHTFGEEIPHNTIGVYSYSKYFGVTGWRLGVISMHENNVVDRIISQLPKKDQAQLDLRYRLTSTTPREIKFIDRLEMDSRDVALAHTGGLSCPQQVMMCLVSLFELMDTKSTYKKSIMTLLKERWETLYKALGLTPPTGPDLTRYYALIDLERLARDKHGKDFASWLAKQWALDFVIRLARDRATVCLPGAGFAGPEWSLRVALANVEKEECRDIGKNIIAILDQYHSQWEDAKD
jgi:aspartate 4-decarboxylase